MNLTEHIKLQQAAESNLLSNSPYNLFTSLFYAYISFL